MIFGILGENPPGVNNPPVPWPGVKVITPLVIGVKLELPPLLYSKPDTVPNTNTPLDAPGASVIPLPGNGTSENSLFGPATTTGILVPIAVQAPGVV